MEQQELFYPDLLVTIGDYQFDQGISLKTYIDRNRPFDWGKISFSNPYKEHPLPKSGTHSVYMYPLFFVLI